MRYCSPNTLLINPGIDSPTVCITFALQDDSIPQTSDEMQDMMATMINRQSSVLENQDIGSSVEATTINSIGFGEISGNGDLEINPNNVFMSDDSGFDLDRIFSFTSIADEIDQGMSIISQRENVPIIQAIVWSGESSAGDTVGGIYSWALDNDCGKSDLTAILDGDEFGKLLFSQVVEQPFDYCRVPTSSPSVSSMPSDMPSNQPSSQPSEVSDPGIRETPQPTVSPETPFPTISPTSGSTPTVGKDTSTRPTFVKRTIETDVEQEASNDLANLTLTEKVTKDCVQHYDEAWSTKRNAVVTGCVNVCLITTTVYQGDVEKSTDVETTKEICDNRGVML